ncbi:MAG: porin family protein, partial [Gammaproteobacteria bacterium]|nr:porin family protein [Gammaproteobacteria bacterium]
ETGMSYENYEILTTGMVDTQQLFVELFELETNAGDGYGLQYNRERQVLVEDFEIVDGVIIPVGDYEYGALGIEISGAEQRAFAPSIEVSSGDFFNGDITSIEAGIDWRPNNRLFFGLEYEYNDVELPAGDFVTRLIQVRANYAFNVRWSWVNLIQYDNESSEVGINSRLRWNPRSGQDFYLVINHGFDAERAFRNLSSVESQVSLKYTHTFRF